MTRLSAINEGALSALEDGDAEADLRPIVELLAELHVCLLGVEDGGLQYSLRGEPQPPLPRRRLAEARPGA